MLGHKFDFSLKIVIVGDSGVGKTSSLNRFVRGKWDGETQQTLGVDFFTKVIETGKYKIQLQLWDTAGQEIFRSVTKNYYRGAAGALIMFDLTSLDTFTAVESWLNDIKEVGKSDVIIILLGNKADLIESRQVDYDTAKMFADRHNVLYFETSAKNGQNIDASINALVEKIENGADPIVFKTPKCGDLRGTSAVGGAALEGDGETGCC